MNAPLDRLRRRYNEPRARATRAVLILAGLPVVVCVTPTIIYAEWAPVVGDSIAGVIALSSYPVLVCLALSVLRLRIL